MFLSAFLIWNIMGTFFIMGYNRNIHNLHEICMKFDNHCTKLDEFVTKYNPEVIKYRPSDRKYTPQYRPKGVFGDKGVYLITWGLYFVPSASNFAPQSSNFVPIPYQYLRRE